MELFFNNAGPSRPGDNYMIDPLQRIDLANIEALIAQKRYFVLHAPRQTGKTTCLIALMEHLNQQGDYQALYANIETAQLARDDIVAGNHTIAESIAMAAEDRLDNEQLTTWLENNDHSNHAHNLVNKLLRSWTRQSTKPTVLFLDEVDALVGDSLISLLRQIRAGYTQRPQSFPISIILCGVRDVRDYRMESAHKETVTGGSAFNIKTESLRLGNFSETEVRALWEQHTAATGQSIAESIYPALWQDTRGQPWLVNALGYQLTNRKMPHLLDRTRPITLDDYYIAREALIQSRATHLDQLVDKLKEPRVHRVMSAILSSADDDADIPPDDIQYVADLGLITQRPETQISNRIYQETIPRELTWSKQTRITHKQTWYLTPERRLDMPKLLEAFQQFFREQSKSWIEQFDYKEAGPQLLLQAFLQRIVNGGGRITREYGLGRKRTDLYIEWPIDEQAGFHGEVQKIVLELKLQYGTSDTIQQKGLIQTAEYADYCGADEAHLIIFDRHPDITWEEKIWRNPAQQGTRNITVWGL